jgi:Domain of unknown function (DUF4386)
MTHHVQNPSLGHRRREQTAHVDGSSETSRSIRRASLIGGTGLLLMSALAGFGNFVVLEGLVTDGDAARTAADILASEGMFRLGVASLYLVVVLDVVIAWALLRVFSPVSAGLSQLAAWFRLAYAGVFSLAISQLAGIPGLLTAKTYTSVFGAEQVQAQAMQRLDAFSDIWFAALILFGVHLVLEGYLAYRSGYVPRVLGVLLVIAGLGYAFDSFRTVLSSGSPLLVSTVTFVGEFLLCLWLLVRGRRVSGVAGPRVVATV